MSCPDEDFIMISALQHYLYCPRQFGLIHLEQFWTDNYFTSDGRHLHARVDLPGNHRSSGRRVDYAMPLSSREYGVSGIADAVEFTTAGGRTRVAPVEYKRGGAQESECDAIQLCAQVLCLEEMMELTIDKAWLFYFETRTRMEICVTEKLRLGCVAAIAACHDLLKSGVTPSGTYSAKCRACSLREYCMPPRKLRTYGEDFREMLS